MRLVVQRTKVRFQAFAWWRRLTPTILQEVLRLKLGAQVARERGNLEPLAMTTGGAVPSASPESAGADWQTRVRGKYVSVALVPQGISEPSHTLRVGIGWVSRIGLPCLPGAASQTT